MKLLRFVWYDNACRCCCRFVLCHECVCRLVFDVWNKRLFPKSLCKIKIFHYTCLYVWRERYKFLHLSRFTLILLPWSKHFLKHTEKLWLYYKVTKNDAFLERSNSSCVQKSESDWGMSEETAWDAHFWRQINDKRYIYTFGALYLC